MMPALPLDTNELLLIALFMAAAGGLAYVFIYPLLSGERRAELRKKSLAKSGGRNKGAADRSAEIAARRKQIADSLKEIENKHGKKKLTLEARLAQAGLDWSTGRFYMQAAGMGVAFAALIFFITQSPYYALAGFAIGGLGLPNWIVNYIRKRRINRFVEEFPNAVDVIIRGIKAGLPLGDCLRIIASEAKEPVRTEFRAIVEAQAVGLTIAEAVERIVERIPVAEANFFAIVISIQQRAGGNLSEALGNLSRVLRDRKKMKLKIKAMSSEAKASAGIIGALPFVVSLMVYLSSPRYIELLWLTSTGRIVMAVCGFWMFIGVMSMRKMINFDL